MRLQNKATRTLHQDAMAIFGKFEKPTYFLANTCNPKWPENNIPSYQSASDRPDVVVRVFKQKLDELVEDIQKRQVLENSCDRISEAWTSTLPHASLG